MIFFTEQQLNLLVLCEILGWNFVEVFQDNPFGKWTNGLFWSTPTYTTNPTNPPPLKRNSVQFLQLDNFFMLRDTGLKFCRVVRHDNLLGKYTVGGFWTTPTTPKSPTNPPLYKSDSVQFWSNFCDWTTLKHFETLSWNFVWCFILICSASEPFGKKAPPKLPQLSYPLTKHAIFVQFWWNLVWKFLLEENDSTLSMDKGKCGYLGCVSGGFGALSGARRVV